MPDESSTPTSAQKTAATLLRHKEERRAESLRQIQAQTEDGTLVISHMTVAQHETASEVARQTRAGNQARGKRYRAPDKRDA
jgi:GTP cyclohydrolase III